MPLLWCTTVGLTTDLDLGVATTDPWKALDAGLVLALSTPPEVIRRHAALANARQEPQAHAIAEAERQPSLLGYVS